MEEMFDLGKDAETFATAICTALILNGGKAIAVKIKGEKKQITAADVEKCIDEDGKLDVEKLSKQTDYEKEKIFSIEDILSDSSIKSKISKENVELLQKWSENPDIKITFGNETYDDLTPIYKNSKGEWSCSWADYAPGGGILEGSEEYVDVVPVQLDRYGKEWGYFMGQQGDSYESRSMPEKEQVMKNKYHKYNASKLTANAINEKYKTGSIETKIEILKSMADNTALTDQDIANFTKQDGMTLKQLQTILKSNLSSVEIVENFPEIDVKIKKSTAAGTINRPGGAKQYNMPVSVGTLIKLGLLT